MKRLIAASIAATLLASTAAVAQRDDPYTQGQNYQGQDRRDNDRDLRQTNGGRSNPQGNNNSNSDRPHWSRGDRLPDQYRQDQYIVRDWQQHKLKTPPRGYRWVRNDNDQYLLASIASGVIADIVSQNQYRSDYRWSQGERLSGGYLESRYVVSDWRGSRLHPPGRGNHWVHVNDQYMLTAIASGVIAEIVTNNR